MAEPPLTRSVVTPTAGIDPRIALATSVHASPGVYAVLVGSGMSTAAGVLTGWGVVLDLIRKIAAAEGVDLAEAQREPNEWFTETYGRDPRYDELVSTLACTDLARQALLGRYFDPPASDGARSAPTAAHHGLAWLCATGRVRVILTTNFDRLLEQALQDAGVAAQILSTADDRRGMTPLAHAPATLIKLHGDYRGSMRNSPEELAAYPTDLRTLIDQVFDEYGLVIVGWSADYDHALADAIAACPSRRYPTYWLSHHAYLTERARELVARRTATVIQIDGADEVLSDLTQRVDRLDRQAVRRGRPTLLRHYNRAPEQNSPPQGWAVLPLLQLRAAAFIGPATIDGCNPITPVERKALAGTLPSAPITADLLGFGASQYASAAVEPAATETLQPRPSLAWTPTPEAYQSDAAASYRFGGDAREGISALLTVQLPSFARAPSVVVVLDIALSLKDTILLGHAVRLWTDSVVLATTLVPQTLSTIIPAGADASQVELHALAATTDGHSNNRLNTLTTRLGLSALGTPSRELASSIGTALGVSGGLAEREATELVSEALYYAALANGYLDPTAGINRVRAEFGLPAMESG